MEDYEIVAEQAEQASEALGEVFGGAMLTCQMTIGALATLSMIQI